MTIASHGVIQPLSKLFFAYSRSYHPPDKLYFLELQVIWWEVAIIFIFIEWKGAIRTWPRSLRLQRH
ncbi:hypothetical protein CHR29_17020 [Pseudomonas monteilii]|uniref:Uncharacterized protein n=1 Tax=Pseudomonas monteilii TaxID=76759 RepID=A0AAP7FJ48_9PSED|nr:hypothetical protein CHR29_17020 [Pseudomonas monteilii]AYN99627.1 hypothetical protein D8767_11865 [Pseudomonas sp. LTGT-11-2Z]ERT16646.1 hypothetical protein O162_22255 [Pseudomonas putida SJ3]OAH45088.1 hypothetical protein AYJ70_29355 [Pseudomonas monteilii]